MINSLCITPSPERDRGNGPETRPGIEPVGGGNVIPNLPAIARTLTIHGGEEVSIMYYHNVCGLKTLIKPYVKEDYSY
jgi:hypothetical protein